MFQMRKTIILANSQCGIFRVSSRTLRLPFLGVIYFDCAIVLLLHYYIIIELLHFFIIIALLLHHCISIVLQLRSLYTVELRIQVPYTPSSLKGLQHVIFKVEVFQLIVPRTLNSTLKYFRISFCFLRYLQIVIHQGGVVRKK